jgi:ribosomal protein S18 acetylase RimI-like enzyme
MKVLNQLQSEAKASDRLIKLSVIATNPALSLYERLGFEIVEQGDIYCSMEWKPNHIKLT